MINNPCFTLQALLTCQLFNLDFVSFNKSTSGACECGIVLIVFYLACCVDFFFWPRHTVLIS